MDRPRKASEETAAPATADRSNVSDRMVWIDMEMTGLNPDRDVVIEIATLITDFDLKVLAKGPELVVHQDPALFDHMDAWNQEHHTKSGLWARVVTSATSTAAAERATLDFVKQWVAPQSAPLAGNSIWQDRRFLARHMPALEAYLHYRMIDVSTIKELAKRLYPQMTFVKEKGLHRALADIEESLAELRHYRAHVFLPGGAPR